MSRVSSLFSCKKHNIFSQKNENIPKKPHGDLRERKYLEGNVAFLRKFSASRHAENDHDIRGFIAAQGRDSRRYFRKVFNTDKSFLNGTCGE